MSKNRSRKSKSSKDKSPIDLLVAKFGLLGTIITGILGLIGIFITAYFSYRAITNQTERPIQATQTAEAKLTAIALSASPTVPPTVTESPTATMATTPRFVGYDFETDTQGWNTSEGDDKLASLGTTTLVVHNGSQALELATELFGSGSLEFANRNKEDVYRHTEAMVYFDKIPEGMNYPGPYDLTGKRVSCFVYLPLGLAAQDNAPPAYARLLVRDKNFASQTSEPVMINEDTTEQWFELVFVVREDSESDFDSTQVFGMGVRLDSLDDSTVSYEGPIYIDYCTIDL